MTLDERKMANAEADLMQIHGLIQHIARLGAVPMLRPDAQLAFARVAKNIDMVMADVGLYVQARTESNGSKEYLK